MSEISETEIKSMTKEQNYMQGYKDGKNDVLKKITVLIEPLRHLPFVEMTDVELQILRVIDKYKAESEDK